MIYLLEVPALSGTNLMVVMGILTLVFVGIIFFMRTRFNRFSDSDLTAVHADRQKKSPLDSRNKYPEVDAFRYSGTLLNYGLLAALGAAILAFSWTQYDAEIFIPDDALEIEDDIEIEPPRTAEPPPPPPPPPPPVIEEVPDEEIVE
ncbi:MAG: energy transducer TonB, partial [Saprospiraceae bacterium]|nr:energy transducer TonB [Saprospiraceae bacterium]